MKDFIRNLDESPWLSNLSRTIALKISSKQNQYWAKSVKSVAFEINLSYLTCNVPLYSPSVGYAAELRRCTEKKESVSKVRTTADVEIIT